MASLFTGFFSFIFVLLFMGGIVYAQPIRSGHKSSDNEKEIFYVKMLHKIAEEKITADTTVAFRCVREALDISGKINYNYGIAFSYHLLGALLDYSNQSPAQGIMYYKKSLTLANRMDSARLVAQNYLSIGKAFQRMQIHSHAAEYLLLSLRIFKKNNDVLNAGIAHINIAANYAEWKEDTFNESLQHFDSAFKKATALKSPILYMCATRAFSSALIRHRDYQKAETYLLKTIPMAEKENALGKFLPRLYCNMGEVLLARGEMDAASSYLEKGKAIYENENHHAGTAHAFKLLGDYYSLAGKHSLARQHYLTALSSAQSANLQYTIQEVYEKLGQLALLNMDYKRAFDVRSMQLSWQDSIMREQQALLLSETEWPLSKIKAPLIAESKNNQHLSYVYGRIFLIALITLSFLTIFYLSLRLHKAGRDKATMAREKVALGSKNMVLEKELNSKRSESKHLEEQMESHAKTLTVNSLNLIQKNEILKNIKAKAEEVKKASSLELPAKINSLIHTVNFALNIDKDWEHFRLHFEQVHNNFFDNLKAKYPTLNSNDLKLCALLKLNLDTKEIATVMDISPESVKVARSRLRKKLQLDPSDNLSSFITQI